MMVIVNPMQKLVGMACLVAGVLLLVAGYNAAHELGAQMRHVLIGGFPERARFFVIGGFVLCLLGVFQIYAAKK
jgi:hypothetical protein